MLIQLDFNANSALDNEALRPCALSGTIISQQLSQRSWTE